MAEREPILLLITNLLACAHVFAGQESRLRGQTGSTCSKA